ncbi:citrate/2-methylcitrate synthase [Oxalobacteraceae bacterium A2-2]
MKRTVTAREAAQILGVSAATLYSYVSRGLLASLAEQGVRSKRYDHGEVQRLAARRRDGKQAGHAVEQAIGWGKPILESRITLIRDGVIRYRGHDAIQLARSATLEQTAAILWNQRASIFDSAPATAPACAGQWRALRQLHGGSPPLHRAAALMAAMAVSLPPTAAGGAAPAAALVPGFEPVVAPSRAAAADPRPALMRAMAAALLDRDIDTLPLHEQCRHAWGLAPEHDALIRAALVACADHELNVSTFTVRCVASSGAQLSMALVAGLAALSGERHGGETLRALALVRAVQDAPDMQAALRLHLRGSDSSGSGYDALLPGFAHPLYPDGDPRARLLLSMLPGAEAVNAIARVASGLTGQAPNIDFALAAIEHTLELPSGASQILFALGRSAGWLAHAYEQIEEGRLIRPRARYVGTFDWQI